MQTLYWFGIVIRFTCQICNKESTQRLAISHINTKPAEVNAKIHEMFLLCQQCNLPIVVGTDVSINGNRGTPEELKDKGFPVPPEAFSPPSK
jgi:hypothetical protein